MDLKTLIIFKKSCKFFMITIIFTALLVESSSKSSRTDDCEPVECGNGPKISHPFWIPQQQESHCGSPGFNITCTNNKPIVRISNDDYIVKDIFYANKSILLTNSEVYDENNTCPTPMHNFTIDGSTSPFTYSDTYADLFFFYNCSFDYENDQYSVGCSSHGSYHSFAVFHPELVERNYSTESCQRVVNAPVSGDDINILLEMNYTEILRKGFVLQWGERNGRGKSHTGKYAAIGAATGFFFLVIMFVMFFYLRRRQKRYAGSSHFSRAISSYRSSTRDIEKAGIYQGVHIFKYSELEKATHHFDPKNELGDGGFGTVYQGKLKDGRTVAVKRLYENNYKRVEQFMNEVEILAHLRHQNLVSLYGCTTHHGRELLLVYEFVPNGTVADHLHGEHAKPGLLTWTTRMSIAIETADALAYLHASEVIHRDVKTNNILLDNNFGVKLADFGLSRLFPLDVTHVSTAPQGTPGYVDPEYHECYHLTSKSDVFSFGVVLIELISSKPAVDITRHHHEINLSNMAINKIRSDALDELVDLSLGYETDNMVRKMINSVAELAFQCLQNEREMRPTMEEVLEVLRGIQSEDKERRKPEDLEISRDDAALLKNNSQVLSPDSVAVKWDSTSTTSNSSV